MDISNNNEIILLCKNQAKLIVDVILKFEKAWDH